MLDELTTSSVGTGGPDASVVQLYRPAFAEGFLRDLAPTTLAALLADSTVMHRDAGDVLFGAGYGSATPMIVLTGLVRTAVSVPDGRELTIGHAGPGSIVGAADLVRGCDSTHPPRPEGPGFGDLRTETVTPGVILSPSPARFRRMVSTDASVAWAVTRQLAYEKVGMEKLVAQGVLLPVRARVAHHLLDIAVSDGRHLVARTTHREIACAVGSVREVVSRALRSLQDRALIRQEGGLLVVIDSAGLLDVG